MHKKFDKSLKYADFLASASHIFKIYSFSDFLLSITEVIVLNYDSIIFDNYGVDFGLIRYNRGEGGQWVNQKANTSNNNMMKYSVLICLDCCYNCQHFSLLECGIETLPSIDPALLLCLQGTPSENVGLLKTFASIENRFHQLYCYFHQWG